MSKKKRGEDYMKEEDEILRKVGTGNAFKVPEGYFENLTSEVMDKLPEQKQPAFEVKEPTKWDKLKPLFLYGSHVCRSGTYYSCGLCKL